MTCPSSDLIRIVYFSRNRIALPDTEMAREIDGILAASRVNNARDGVTGALIYNAGVFGQVLEGPSDAVEETFERIQLDDRHAEVTLLEIGPISERSFADWSMGFVGTGDLAADGNAATPGSAFDLSRLSGPDVYDVLHALMIRNEVRTQTA